MDQDHGDAAEANRVDTVAGLYRNARHSEGYNHANDAIPLWRSESHETKNAKFHRWIIIYYSGDTSWNVLWGI